jgi:CBS domain containing-hemolysin-like protein
MKKKNNFRWVISVTLYSVAASSVFTLVSAETLGGAGYITAFAFLFVFIMLGVVFDMIGVAVTAASPGPLHSMAARRERGSAEAIALVKNAEKVSSVCNDVVGDISGIISGTTSAIIVTRLVERFSFGAVLTQIVISAAVTGLTIGGKALGKTSAINNSTAIVVRAGKLIHLFSAPFRVRIRTASKRKK